MDPAEAAEILDAFLAPGENGEEVTFVRITDATSNPPSTVSASCQASVRRYAPHELGNGIIQGDSNVVIEGGQLLELAQRLGTPPRKNDKILIGGWERNVEMVAPLNIGGEIVRLDLTVRG
jgi:hypothetical protein